MSLWRRIRGAVGVVVTWALAWASATLLFTCAWWLVTFPSAFLQSEALLAFLRQAGMAGIVGGIVGTGFSTYVAMQRQESVRSLSPARLMIAGAVAALATFAVLLWWIGALPILAVPWEWVGPAGLLAALGAASGGATLALARRAPDTTKAVEKRPSVPRISSSH